MHSRGDNPLPLSLKLLVLFFCFGATMCALTVGLLSAPGSRLDRLWELNPTAHQELVSVGILALLLMTVVGTACLTTAIGLAIRAEWGRRMALITLSVNLAGDVANGMIRHDYRTLIGLPISAALIAWLCGDKVRRVFRRRERPGLGE